MEQECLKNHGYFGYYFTSRVLFKMASISLVTISYDGNKYMLPWIGLNQNAYYWNFRNNVAPLANNIYNYFNLSVDINNLHMLKKTKHTELFVTHLAGR